MFLYLDHQRKFHTSPPLSRTSQSPSLLQKYAFLVSPGFGPSDHHIPVPRPHTPTEEYQPPDVLEILDTDSKIFVAELDEWQDVRPGISGTCEGVQVNIEVWEDGSDGCWNE